LAPGLKDETVRIALVSFESLAGPAWTESAIVVSETAGALSAHGAEVHVFTARGPRQAAEENMGAVHYRRCAHEPSRDPCKEVKSFALAVSHQVRSLEREAPFAVVHGFNWPAAAALGELRPDGARAAVWSAVSAENEWHLPKWLLEDPDVAPPLRYHPDEFADLVVLPSTQARDQFIAYWGVRDDLIEVIHPGINPTWLEPIVDPAAVKSDYGFDVFDPVVLYIGALARDGRPEFALDAMPQVLESHPGAKLLFAGAGELKDHLSDRTAMLGIEYAVRFLGEVSSVEMARLCQACDVVCMPQRSRQLLAPHLEAWSAGKPVVVARSHTAAAFVWHEVTGYVSDDSSDGIAAGLLWMFADFDRCRWVGGNGRRAVEDAFGWPAVAGKLLDCYKRAAAARGSPIGMHQS